MKVREDDHHCRAGTSDIDGMTEEKERDESNVAEPVCGVAPECTESAPSLNGAGTASGTPLSNDKCVSCGKTAYAMERLTVEGELFHPTCFKCTTCQHKLSVGNFSRSNEGKYYCSTHYEVMFKVRGRYGFKETGSNAAEGSDGSSAAQQVEATEDSAQIEPDSDPQLEKTTEIERKLDDSASTPVQFAAVVECELPRASAEDIELAESAAEHAQAPETSSEAESQLIGEEIACTSTQYGTDLGMAVDRLVYCCQGLLHSLEEIKEAVSSTGYGLVQGGIEQTLDLAHAGHLSSPDSVATEWAKLELVIPIAMWGGPMAHTSKVEREHVGSMINWLIHNIGRNRGKNRRAARKAWRWILGQS